MAKLTRKTTTGRLSSRKVLEECAKSQIGDVIVIGRRRGEQFVATAMPSSTRAQMEATLDAIRLAGQEIERRIAVRWPEPTQRNRPRKV